MTIQEMRSIRRQIINNLLHLRHKLSLSQVKWWTREEEYREYGEELKAYEF